jgi:3-oxoacyl-[acyl-carrier protein] reductase
VTIGPAPPVGRLLDVTDRVVVVTGVSGGIGQGIARRFAEAGASLVLHCRHDRAAAEVLAAELGERATVVAGDLLQPGVADDVATAAVERFGHLDAWISNAGVQPVGGLMEMDHAAFRAVVDGNLTTAFLATQAAATRMVGGGAVVNVASIEALQPAPGHSHYAAAKAAVIAHTRAAALELGPSGVRVNAVAPGLIDRHGLADAWPEGVERWLAACPLGRLGQPEDVADACLFLASDAARWITGAVLVVDGGVLTRPTW